MNIADMLNEVSLRPIEAGDIAALFAFSSDKRAIEMAGTGRSFGDEVELAAHFRKVQKNGAVVRVILHGTNVAGYMASFERFEKREISYWVGRAFWGQGVASKAVVLWLEKFPVPDSGLYARVVDGNPASARVLEKNGFTPAGRDSFYSDVRGCEVEETLYKLTP